MGQKELGVYWTDLAKKSLLIVHTFCAKQSVPYAEKIIAELVEVADTIIPFTYKFPVEEYLGEPFRFLLYGHYKIIYRVLPTRISIVKVFDTRQALGKLSKGIRKSKLNLPS